METSISFIIGLSIIGFTLSAYAAYVERKSSKNSGYKAACDINDRISCSKAFTSKYGKTLGISNAVGGIIFYPLILTLSLLNLMDFIFYLSMVSVIASIYLYYIMHFKVKTLCIVCVTIYIVNILIFSFSMI